MQSLLTPSPLRALRYDHAQRRLWILGQRCHHGATGAVLATAGALSLLLSRGVARSRDGLSAAAATDRGSLVLASLGSVLMAHDWKDHSIWFERGPGSQA